MEAAKTLELGLLKKALGIVMARYTGWPVSPEEISFEKSELIRLQETLNRFRTTKGKLEEISDHTEYMVLAV